METTTPVTVPAEFEALYRSLSQALDEWESGHSGQSRAAAEPVFGAHVLAANGNRGPALLAPGTIQAVDLTLDRLQQLGVQGATITLSFPLLNTDFPRSADYISFYETVARHVRARGMVFTVEQHVIFHGTPFSPVQYDFAGLSFDDFVALDRQMTRTVIERLQPDYLTLLSEPDTFATLTGYRQALTPAGAAAMIERVVEGLARGRTKIGAGAGSWLPNAGEYAAAFARTSLDYVDLHIYPITAGTMRNAQAVVDAARAADKPVVLDEAWLYKIGPGENLGGVAAAPEAFRRDAFSFWAPLDARFLSLVTRFARANGIAYVAPFWSTFFWGYVDYGDDTKGLPYQRLEVLVNQKAGQGLRDATYTDAGRAYGEAVDGR